MDKQIKKVKDKEKERKSELFWGVILVGLGLLALASQFIEWGSWGMLGIFFLPLLGTAFLAWGIMAREAGPFIPGGIISGIGWGVVLIGGPWHLFSGDTAGGVFMLVFAAGWILIPLLTAVFAEETHWWALIPGGIFALVGLGVLFGGLFLDALSFAGRTWPAILIIVGVYIIFQALRNRTKQG